MAEGVWEQRPTKKQHPDGPDGFRKSKPTSRYKPPESITKFVSAFDPVKPRIGDIVADDAGGSHHSLGKRPVRNPFLDSHAEVEAGPSRPSAVKWQLKPSSSGHTGRSSPLKVLKPPVFLPPPARKVDPLAGVRLRSLQSAPPPSENARSILKPPPVPSLSEVKPSVPLKPLAPPPPLPLRPPSPKKPMKTILTTNVAQATDPTKEGTGAELLSLFLQQHGHTFMSSTDRELQRGVMVSPDKRSRGKDLKFIRGGLAERFHHRISCTKTDFTLWKRQMEQKIESGTRFGSDMHLRILMVLDVIKPSERSRFTAGPRCALAFCRLTWRHPLTSGDLTLGTYVVVFHFAPTNGGRSPVSGIDRFEQGNDVMVWLPWQKVELIGLERNARLLDMFRALDVLTPPRSLLVVSRFYIVAPKPTG